MRRLVIAIALLAGCHLTPETQVADVAEELCRCLEPTDATCTAAIEQDLGMMVTQDCIECVFDDQRTCAAMIDECTPLCFRNLPQPGGP